MWNYFSQIFKSNERKYFPTNYEFTEEFKITLKEAYLFIENAIEVSFIKSKNSNAKAVLLTFNLQEQPFTLYIPAQSSDTAVYKYQDRPMICHKNHKYGNTKTRCRRKVVCRNCGKEHDTSDKTNQSPNEYKCVSCGQGHMAGSNNCEVKKIKADSRVGRRALQILTGEHESPRSHPQSYPTHFRYKMDPENKRTFNKWAIEKNFTQKIGSKPATIRTNNASQLLIDISNEKERKFLPITTTLCSSQFQERVDFEMFACDKIHQGQGLTYIHDYNIPDIEDHSRQLNKEYNLLDVKKLAWLKRKTLLLLHSYWIS